MSELVLHGYWRSGTSYRTRIALNLKGLSYRQVGHDLRTGKQKDAAYLALNPQGLVPSLESPDGVLTQSPAILEYLEERYPDPPLLPKGMADRATVRAMAALIACDIHPLNNLRVLKSLKQDLSADQAQIDAWIARWIVAGFTALEAMVARHGHGFCFGAAPTIADCHLVPQYYSGERFGVDLSPFPRIGAVVAAMRALPPVAAASPEIQPDAD